MRPIVLGMTEFRHAYALQEEAVASVAAGGEERLFLLEHAPVYTIGSGGSCDNVLDPRIEAVRINRGGDVTFHGPGQLVGYPIIDLSRRGRDLHRYLRFLEELLVGVAAHFDVKAHTVAGRTGVWTAAGKLASIGVGVRRWVTMHGFALNVVNDLTPFSRINPCGMAGCPLTSLSLECGHGIGVDEAGKAVSGRFEALLAARLPLVETR